MENAPIILPQPLQETLEALAKIQNKPVVDLVQEALNLYFFAMQKAQPQSMGLGDSGYTDLSERVDELLWQEP